MPLWDATETDSLEEAAEDAKERVGKYDPEGEDCNCIKKVVIVGHGTGGNLVFGDDDSNIFPSQVGKDDQQRQQAFESQKGVQALKEIDDLMCEDGEFHFTVYTADDAALRQQLGSALNHKFHLNAGAGGGVFWDSF